MDHLVFLMLLHLFIAALWLPARKGLTSLALVGDVYYIFVTFPCGILGQVWYFIYRFLIFASFLTLSYSVSCYLIVRFIHSTSLYCLPAFQVIHQKETLKINKMLCFKADMP